MRDKRTEAFVRLLDVMDRLRIECPWDREQTFESLRNCTIEECYELVDAIADNNMDDISAELGDLMLHIVFYSKIGEEQNAFNVTDVLNGICDKLIYRHPHVFGTVEVDGKAEVLTNWEDLKRKEGGVRKGVLAGVPKSLPSMVKAFRIGQKAASSGFDWGQKEDVWKKVAEEVSEIEAEMDVQDQDKIMDEFGDLFFSLINAARLYNVDPELALERTNKKFISRFNYMEQKAEEQNTTLKEMTLERMEELWAEAKQLPKT